MLSCLILNRHLFIGDGHRIIRFLLISRKLISGNSIVPAGRLRPLGELQLQIESRRTLAQRCKGALNLLSGLRLIDPVLRCRQIDISQAPVGHDMIRDLIVSRPLCAVGGLIPVILRLECMLTGDSSIFLQRHILRRRNITVSHLCFQDIDVIRIHITDKDQLVPGVAVAQYRRRVFQRLICFFIIDLYRHRLPVHGIAVVDPLFADHDPIACPRSVDHIGMVIARLGIPAGLIYRRIICHPFRLQHSVLIPASFFVKFIQGSHGQNPRFALPHGDLFASGKGQFRSLLVHFAVHLHLTHRFLGKWGAFGAPVKGKGKFGFGDIFFRQRLAIRTVPQLFDGIVDLIGQTVGHRRGVDSVLTVGGILRFRPVGDRPGYCLAVGRCHFMGHLVGSVCGTFHQILILIPRIPVVFNPLVNAGFHPAVFQFLPLHIVFWYRGLGRVVKMFRIKFRHGDHCIGIRPGIFRPLHPGLQLHGNRHILEIRLEGGCFPVFAHRYRHRIVPAVGQRPAVVHVGISLLPGPISGNRVNYGAVSFHLAEHLIIMSRMFSFQIFPNHIDILIAVGIVFLQIRKGDFLRILRRIQLRGKDQTRIVPHRRRRGEGLPFSVAPELKGTLRPF